MSTLADKSLTTIRVKEINRRLVTAALYQKSGLTKQQLVSQLSMSLSTVDQNLRELNEQGFVEELGFSSSTGGRKAKLMRLKSRLKVSIGIFALKGEVHLLALDLYGEKIAGSTLRLGYAPGEDYIRRLGAGFADFLEVNNLKRAELLPVTFAVQGLVDRMGQAVTFGKLMNNETLTAKALEEVFGTKVKLCHDSFAAAFWELKNHPEIKDAVLLLLNRNFGGALIINGEVLAGLNGRSGVIEHYCVDPEGPLCYCGCRGCLETYCKAEVLSEKSGLSLEEFFVKLRQGDEQCLEIFEACLKVLALAARNFLSLVDGHLIISGLLGAYLEEADLIKLLGLINDRTPFKLAREEVILGQSGDATVALGAALMGLNSFLESSILQS